MVNYLSLLGWNDGTEKEIYTVEELQDAFNLERITKVRPGRWRGRAPAGAP
jgi:glutamyl-tRNA synthetase